MAEGTTYKDIWKDKLTSGMAVASCRHRSSSCGERDQSSQSEILSLKEQTLLPSSPEAKAEVTQTLDSFTHLKIFTDFLYVLEILQCFSSF
jgi:hypothetical protein